MEGWTRLPIGNFNQIHAAGFTLRSVIHLPVATALQTNYYFERTPALTYNPAIVLILAIQRVNGAFEAFGT